MKEYGIFNPIEITIDGAFTVTLTPHHRRNGLKKWRFVLHGSDLIPEKPHV
jgi:hypothetical protein